MVFRRDHIIIVEGFPKELGTGEVQVLYTVLYPTKPNQPLKLTSTEAVIRGVEESTSIIRNSLNSEVIRVRQFVQTTSTPSKTSDNTIIIGAAIGGAVVVLVVLIITIGCCVTKRFVFTL